MADAVFFTFIALMAILFVRNNLVYKFRIRRLNEIHDENVAALNAGTCTEAMCSRYGEMPSYDSQLFDLRKWTYRQFFPEAA